MRIVKLVSVGLMIVVLAGCPGFQKKPTHTQTFPVQSQLQLGQVNMTISKPIPWYQVKEEFKPQFNIDSAGDLLDDVNPVVGGTYTSSSLRQAIKAEVAYQGLNIDNTKESTEESNTDAEGNTTTTSSSSDTKVASKSTPDTKVEDAQASESSLSFKTPDLNGQYDPFTKYNAATAVYQRIKALDTYLDTDYNTEDTAAFLVHTQITPIAYSINQPFDVFSTITLDPTVEYSNREEYKKTLKESKYRIFPLIVVDNPERVSSEQRSKEAKEFLGKLSASSGQVAGGLSVQRVRELLQVTYGDDFNSLHTVSQNNERDLMVRIGAGFDPDSHYEIRNRPVDVSFVVTVDRNDVNGKTKTFEAYMSNVFRNVFDGVRIPQFNETDVKTIAKEYREYARCETEINAKIAQSHIRKYLQGGKKGDLCWIANKGVYKEILGERQKLIHEGHRISFGPLNDFPPTLQNVIFTDDKESLKAILVNKKNSDTTLLQAALLVNPDNINYENLVYGEIKSDYLFLSRDLEQENEVLTLSFPSLRALGQDVEQANLYLLLSLESNGSNAVQYPMHYQAAAEKKKSRSPSFTLGKVTDRFQGDDKTQLNALLTIKPVKAFAGDIAKFRIGMSGVVLTGVTGLTQANTPVVLQDATLDVANSSFAFKPGKEAAYRLQLQQKGPQTIPLTVTVQGLDKNDKGIGAESQKVVFK